MQTSLSLAKIVKHAAVPIVILFYTFKVKRKKKKKKKKERTHVICFSKEK
jgi:hypothetical protein